MGKLKQLNRTNYSEYLAGLNPYSPTYHDNRLNCLMHGYLSWQPRNWFHNIDQFFRNIRHAWQRAIHGYCDWDTWDMDNYLHTMIADMLDDLAVNTHGYPGTAPYTELEKWQNDLHQVARWLRSAEDEDNNYYVNPLTEDYFKELLNDNNITNINTNTELSKMYFEIESNIWEKRAADDKKAFDWLATYHRQLWD